MAPRRALLRVPRRVRVQAPRRVPVAPVRFPLQHLPFARPPPLLFCPPGERIKGHYLLSEENFSTNALVMECNNQLPGLYNNMREYRSDIVLRIAKEVTANDAYSFRQGTKALIQQFNDAVARAVHLRQAVEDLGGIPLAEPAPLMVPFIPEGF